MVSSSNPLIRGRSLPCLITGSSGDLRVQSWSHGTHPPMLQIFLQGESAVGWGSSPSPVSALSSLLRRADALPRAGCRLVEVAAPLGSLSSQLPALDVGLHVLERVLKTFPLAAMRAQAGSRALVLGVGHPRATSSPAKLLSRRAGNAGWSQEAGVCAATFPFAAQDPWQCLSRLLGAVPRVARPSRRAGRPGTRLLSHLGQKWKGGESDALPRGWISRSFLQEGDPTRRPPGVGAFQKDPPPLPPGWQLAEPRL